MNPSQVVAVVPALVFLLAGAVVWTVPSAMSPILSSGEIPDAVRGIGGAVVLLGSLGTVPLLGALGAVGVAAAALGLLQAVRPISRVRVGDLSPRRTGLVLALAGVVALAVSLG